MSVSDLDRLYVWNGEGAASPLAELANPQLKSGPARIDRFERERTVTVRAYTEFGHLTSSVTQDVARQLASLRMPAGYTLSFGGAAEAQERSFGGLLPATMVALFGILAVLLLEFRSFSTTAVVAFVIPFGIMGGLIALAIAGESLSFTAIIGFVALVGIEIKNSILLVEFANQQRAQRRAIARSDRTRRRSALPAGAADLAHGHRRPDRRSCSNTRRSIRRSRWC